MMQKYTKRILIGSMFLLSFIVLPRQFDILDVPNPSVETNDRLVLLSNPPVRDATAGTIQSLEDQNDLGPFSVLADHPVINYFNEVNNDTDSNNDIEGEIVQCSIDGDYLPLIFLCGANDSQLISINVSAASVSWEKLVEGSCDTFGDQCPNKSPVCSWTTVGSGNNFFLDAAGSYRVVLNLGSGSQQRYYFNSYQNNLNIEYTKADIGCEPVGNIQINNLGTNYGYQLVNADSNGLLVPFSANNGPSFVIGSNGNYRVEVSQLNPDTGEPIENGCVFSTPVIQIGTSNFSVSASSIEADCTGVGSVTATVTDGSPNFDYELRLDDGLDGGRGTLINVITDIPDSTYTFEGVGQGNYVVVGRNSDGCEQSATTEVLVSNDNTLTFTARVSQHITCKEGNILVDPHGGKPPYRYAVWKYIDESDNLQTNYNSPEDIPNSEFQTSEIFDILYPGNYAFVLVDRFGCFTISNSVDIEFVPPATFDDITETDVACFGEATGALQMNMIDDGGYQLTYYLFDYVIPELDVLSGNFNLADAISFNASGYFPALVEGEYTIVVNMRKGSASCDYPYYGKVTGPNSILEGEAVVLQQYSCVDMGEISAANFSGGTPGYEYSLNGSTWQTGVSFEDLAPGTYSIFIRDQAGCLIETNNVEILPVDEPEDLIFDSSQITCTNTISDLTATVVGGTAPLSIEIIAPTSISSTSISGHIANFEGLAPGTYRFAVTDANECTYEESYTILPISTIGVVGEILQNVSCEGANDGALRYTIDGFETTYSYTVTNSAGVAITTGNSVTDMVISLNNLPSETYTIAVTDDITSCQATANSVIEAPASILTATLAVTDITCSTTGANPGSVVITANGGWGSYQYELADSSGNPAGTQSGNTFTGLTDVSGPYTVTVTDSGNCIFSDTFSLSPISPPVLDVMANSLCYDNAMGLTLTATVTSGGDSNYRYRLNNGEYVANNVFSGLAPGTYTIGVIDGRNCVAYETITVNAQMDIAASAQPIPACEGETEVLITASGGDGNFVYAVVPIGATPASSNFSPSNTITLNASGTYDVYVRDNGGNMQFCEAMDSVVITQDPVLEIDVTVDPQVIPCAGESNASITIAGNGGLAPYLYSIDGGTTFQTQNSFVNLASGDYIVIVRDQNDCEVTEIVNIPENFTLSASAAVTQTPSCTPGLGAEVQIVNAQGGTEPYEYSFDGGNTFSNSSVGYLQPGTHLLVLQDANGCSFDMTITIDPAPEEPTFIHEITYDCTGEGTIAVNPSSTDFDYTFTIDGAPNSPLDSNIFTGVSTGYHTITVNYLNNTPIAPSILLSESFGSGSNTAISEVDPVYCYEPQNGTDNGCPHANGINNINDGEYSVTQSIIAPFGTWISPNDHSGDTNGRYLAMNVGDVAGSGGIIYAKQNITVVPNRDINLSLWAMNLLRQGTSGGDPNIEIQLVDPSGNVIASTTTGNIPKNSGADDWRNYSVTLNPGANSNLDIVIRTFSIVTNGNDIAVDDIQATQAAEDCPNQQEFQVYIEEGLALDAAITATANPLCVADANGSIAFEVENFSSAGFVYSTDGGSTFSTPQTTTPILLNNLSAGSFDITIRDASNASCETAITATLTDPMPVMTDASVTQDMTCINMTAIITANATGGAAGYEYQLENATGAVIVPYQTGATFTIGVAGDYNIRARDANGCDDITNTPINVTEPETLVFDVIATTCYNGNNDASIQIDVAAGNSNYQFQIDNGPWLTPSPTTSAAYTFGSLPSGSYTVNVKDGLGCIGSPVPVSIGPELTAIVDTTPISTCDDGNISVSASGGDNDYVFAFVLAGNDPSGSFSSSNTYTVSSANAGSYDVYVRDNAGNNPHCEYVQTVTLGAPTQLVFTATPQDPQCNGDNGQITVNITSGERPYNLELRDLDNGSVLIASYIDQVVNTRVFYNVSPGNYEVIVTDSYGCPVTQSPITIDQPVPLAAVIDPILPANCDDPDALSYGFRFINYPTTLGGTLQFSDDGGQNWSTSDTFMGHISGSSVYPSIRTVDSLGNTLCREDYPRYIIPYPLDQLNITVLPQIADCAELRVQVQGSQGNPPYEYTYTDNPANFDPLAAVWDGPFIASYVHQYNGLIPGRTYVFFVRDNAGCVRQSDVNVNDLVTNPFDIVGDFEPACFGANDGSVTFTISNNSGNTYPQMHWEFYDLNTGAIVQQSPGNVAWTSTLSFTGLAPSEYYVVITGVDATNTDQCVSGSENQLIIEQQPITAELFGEDMTCEVPGYIHVSNINGGGGSVTFNVTGPAGFTAIVGSTDNPIEIPTGSPAGTYAVQVIDQYGCEFVGALDLDLPVNPVIDSIAIDNCTNPTTVTISASGPSTDIVYSLDGGSTYEDNGGVFDNVAPGTYSVMVKDGNGCAATGTITVHPVLQAVSTLTKLLDCSVNPEAEIRIEVQSGSGNYEIAIYDGTADVLPRTGLVANPYVFSTPNAGAYTITIWDSDTDPECFRELVVEIPTLVAPVFDPVSVDVSCFNGSDGAIAINETDRGIGPITYTILPNIGTFDAASGRFEDLPAGTYTLSAEANNECVASDTVTVGQPDEIIVQDPVVTEFGCATGNNPNNATITLDANTVVGGTGTYLVYEFINDGTGTVVQRGSETTYTETDLAGGTFTINVYDDNGCVGTTNAEIQPYDELQAADITVTPVSCVPGNDGALTIGVTSSLGDATKFEYSLDNGTSYQAINSFNGLSAGNYLVTVRHIDTKCIITANATIKEPNTFNIEVDVVQNVVCHGTDSGEVRFLFTDASYTGDFNYTVYNTNNTPSDTGDDTTEFTSTTSVAVNTASPVLILGGGSYRVVAIQDEAPQCIQETLFSIATPQDAMTGLQRKIDITCSPGNDGIIEIYNVQGGWGGYTYYVGAMAPADANSFVSTPRFENLVAGTYEAWVMDVNGCQQLIDDTIELFDPEPITADLQVNNENCMGANGELEVINTVGGQGSNYLYQLIKDGTNFGAPQNTSVFAGLDAGVYEVRISDQWGCEATIGPEVFFVPVVASYDVVQAINCDGDAEITLNATGGTGNFEYQLSLPDGGTITNANGMFTGLNHSADSPADYVFTVTDLNTDSYCSTTITVTLDKPTPITLEPTTWTNISCPTSNDGTITVNLEPTTEGVNDDPIYTYRIISGDGTIDRTQESSLFTGLHDDIYDITIMSGRNCLAIDQVEIKEPLPLTADDPTVDPFVCDSNNAIQMATINVTNIQGGTLDYFYSLDGINFYAVNGTSISHEVTQDGDYNIVLRDANGCTLPLPTITVDPLPKIILDVTEGAVNCPTGQEIIVTSTGHSQNPSVDLTFTLLETSETQPNLSTSSAVFYLTEPGTYTVQVTDNVTGCSEYIGHTIDPRPEWGAFITAANPISCYGTNTGSLEVDIAGYAGTFTYELFNADGSMATNQGSLSTTYPLFITDLSSGNYYVRLTPTDYPYCLPKETSVATIASPNTELSALVSELRASGCPDNLGEISVVPEGGYGPFDLTLIHSGGQQYDIADTFGYVFTDLASGNYSVLVVDSEGCEWNGSANVASTPPLIATAIGTNPICYENPDGIIVVDAQGGSENYSYYINYYDEIGSNVELTPTVPQNNSEFNGLGEGYYSITVTDDMGCSDTTEIIHLEGPDQLTAEMELTSPMTCVDDSRVTVRVTGGMAPYEYYNPKTDIWEAFNEAQGAGSHTYDVSAGMHYAQVRDANNCDIRSQLPVVVFEIPPVELNIDYATDSVTCSDDMDAVIHASAVGGVGEYNFEILLNGGVVDTQNDFRSAVFENLAPGSYTVRVTSEGGCNPDEQIVTIIQPEELVYSTEITHESCVDQMDGAITINLSGGSGGYQFAISPNMNQFFEEDPEQGLPPGSYRFDELEPGTYTVIAQDVLGCFFVNNYTIEPATQVMATYISTPETCEGNENGTITLEIMGGTAPYSTSLNTIDNFVQNQLTYTDLASGAYFIYVRDANDCEYVLPAVVDPGANLNAEVAPIYGCTEYIPNNYVNIILEDETISENVMYALDSTDPLDTQLNPYFRDLAPGPHFVSILSSSGCIKTYDFEIIDYEPLSLTLQQNNINEITAIAQGGREAYTFYFGDIDNGSDNTFVINRTDTYEVTVVDENGCEAVASIYIEFIDIEIPNFFTPNGDNENDFWKPRNIQQFPEILIKIYDRYGRVVAHILQDHTGWDGKYNEKELPSGDYWYVIQLNGENDEREFFGHFTLYR